MSRSSWRPSWGFCAAALLVACGPKAPPPPPPPPPVPLHLEPACDLAPAAGLSWIVDAKPRAIAEIPDLIPAIALVLPEERLRLFTAAHGGVDLRQTKEVCVAKYQGSLLEVARVPLDAEKIASAFEQRSTKPITRTLVVPNPRVLRITGAEVAGEPEQLLLFGQEEVVLEQGKAGPFRAAEAFAFGKLKRAQPAIRSAALKRASELLGEGALVRMLAPGPFEGEAANGLGGLLRATTAVGASAKWTGTKANIAVRVVLTGAWGDDAKAAGSRFGAAAHVLSESEVGHLFGLHAPVQAPFVHEEPDALVLDAVYDGNALARGIHDAVDAEVADIMRR